MSARRGVVFIIVLFNSCKKQTDCTPGAKSYANPEGIQKSPKSPKSDDPCAFERNEVQEADSLLNNVYGPDVRDAVDPAVSYPENISTGYWNIFNYLGGTFVPCTTLLDSAERHQFAIDRWVSFYGWEYNEENLKNLYAKCGTYLLGYEDLQKWIGALDECENGVGIIKPNPTYICDDNGDWRDFLTGKIVKTK